MSGAAGNYTFMYVSGTLTVLPRAATVRAHNLTAFAGIPNLAFNGENDILAADAAQIEWAYSPVGYRNCAGVYAIGATATDPNHRLANYTLTQIDGQFTAIELPGAAVSSNPVITVYDGMPEELGRMASVISTQTSKPLLVPALNNYVPLEISPALEKILGYRPKLN